MVFCSVMSITYLLCIVPRVCSLISSPLKIPAKHAQPPPGTRTNNRVNIRPTKKEDLATIVDLLSFETSKETPNLFNWNAKMQRLKHTQSLNEQLSNRLSAIQAGREVLKSPIIEEYKNTDVCLSQILWSDDSFRNKCETAVKTTLEYNQYPTLWDNHNFALTPNPSSLNHFMLTAVDPEFLNEAVGFCEVGIMTNADADDDEDELFFCVANLVVSPNQRRRGIGKHLMASAIRMMRIQGKRGASIGTDAAHPIATMGLYVDGDNVEAIRLYEKMGFTVKGQCNHVQGRIFMQMKLEDYVQERGFTKCASVLNSANRRLKIEKVEESEMSIRSALKTIQGVESFVFS